jgi:uncharacterized protein (TIGR02147 family)
MKNKYANIFEYIDFRQFLKDYQKKRYKTDKSFSKSGICRKLGLPNTRSYFNDALNRRNLSKAYVERFINVFELNEEEAQYFRVLVQFNQSVIEKDRTMLFDQLISLNRTPQKLVDPSAYAYYSKWYHSVIYTILDVEDFKNDYARLAKLVYPHISAGKARESIELLKKLKFIKRNPRGYWKPTERSLTVGSYVKNELIKQYQIQSLEQTKKAILDRATLPKNITTMTFSTSGEIYKKIEKKLQEFKSEVRSMVHKDLHPSDRVYSLNIQCIPQTQKVKK